VGVGTPVVVTFHAYAQEGVAEIALSVNGEEYIRKPAPQTGEQFIEITQEWLPEAAGEYVLQIRAYDTKGEVSNPASVRVEVVPAVTLRMTTPTVEAFAPAPAEEPTDTPTGTAVQVPTGTATQAPTEAAVHSPTGTAEATSTFAPSPTFSATSMPTITPTPIPPVEVSFSVEQDSITSGGCTVLHWDVEHATAVQLDGAGVASQGTRQVCPASTTSYHLHVVAPAGDVDRYVTVTVTAPPDTTPPNISGITESDDPIRPPDGEPGPDSVTISATITDPSGVPKVELHFRVEGGVWVWRTMNPAGGVVYQAALGHDQLRMSLFPYEDADTVEYYIKAWDSKTNMTQSPTQTLGVDWTVL